MVTERADDVQVPEVGAREPCPCGSGRRYKACHGRAERVAAPPRPFAGLTDECDWVALREIVPAATAPLEVRDAAGTLRPVVLSTVLPMACAALVRLDGTAFVALQTTSGSGDPSRDVAAALVAVAAADPGTMLAPTDVPRGPERLQQVLEPGAPLRVTVHEGFDYWLDGALGEDGSPLPESDVAESLKRANDAVVPTARLASVAAAYWAGLQTRTTLRWVLPEDEEPLLDALARLHSGGSLGLGEGTRFIGTFRAHGLLVPVWDLPLATTAEETEPRAAAFRADLDDALTRTEPLTSAERHARAGLQTRQLTLR
jgi:Family of unknown function (DUF5926)/SEC-C motif